MPTIPSLPSFDESFSDFKQQYHALSRMRDYVIFSAFCSRYFFFDKTVEQFNPDGFLECVPDGANDGGIDAIFANPDDDEEIVIVQSKFYSSTTRIAPQTLKTELDKIADTVRKLRAGATSGFSDKLIHAFSIAHSLDDDLTNLPVQVAFFTSWKPDSANARRKLLKICDEKSSDNLVFHIFFRDDIERKLLQHRQQSLYIDSADLNIDHAGNALQYADSIIVNVSAKSIKQLYSVWGNAALGLNLRYHVKGSKVARTVDREVKDSISTAPSSFWYKNNGILFACKDYSLDGIKLHIEHFSIVNGGQTTFLISTSDIEEDFFVQCKVVKAIGATEEERNRFCHEMAKATNSQKPISLADLRANSPEQLDLKTGLQRCGVYYITKSGDSTRARSSKPYQITKLEKVGKISAACMLLHPGLARANLQQTIYQEDNYWKIFGNPRPQLIADFLKIEFYYDRFRKSMVARGVNSGLSTEVLSMVANGTLYMLACFAFIAKITAHVFSYEDFLAAKRRGGPDFSSFVERMGELNRFFASTNDDEELIVESVFKAIARRVFGGPRTVAKRMMEEQSGREFVVSNYLKSDSSFFDNIVPDLWSCYVENEAELKTNFNKLLT